MARLLYIEKVKENQTDFEAKVKNIASSLGINPNWLMSVMQIESGLNHRAQNTAFPLQGGFATGLIQFTPATAKSLGTSTDALLKMSNIQQLDYVLKYFTPYKAKLKSFIDLYMVTFFPATVGKSGNTTIETSKIKADTIARLNPVFDLNKDKKITVAEFEEAVLKKFPASVRELLKKKSLDTELSSPSSL